jgi:hypothetical protein
VIVSTQDAPQKQTRLQILSRDASRLGKRTASNPLSEVPQKRLRQVVEHIKNDNCERCRAVYLQLQREEEVIWYLRTSRNQDEEIMMQETATSYDLRSLFEYRPFATTFVLYLLAVPVPIIKLLRRTGHNPIWSLFAFIPILNVLAFWVFAFKPWPTNGKPRTE